MNAATRAASISADSRAGAGGCLVVLARAARRRDDLRLDARRSAWSPASPPVTSPCCGPPTPTRSATSPPTSRSRSTRSSCTGSSPSRATGSSSRATTTTGWTRTSPTADEVLGTLFRQVPQGGKVLDAIASPWSLTLMFAVAFGLFGTSRTRKGAAGPASPRRPLPDVAGPHLPALALPTFSMPTRAQARQVADRLGRGRDPRRRCRRRPARDALDRDRGPHPAGHPGGPLHLQRRGRGRDDLPHRRASRPATRSTRSSPTP